MKTICTCLFLLLFTAIEFSWGGQQLETIVFPSEDEIVEALSLGEISIDQFYILTELISNRVKPSSFLLDEIPNSLLSVDTTFENVNQEEYFIVSKKKHSSHAIIHNRYASYLDETASTRVQSSLLYEKENFEFNLILKKEFSGRERFLRRYFAYTPKNSSYNIIVGNFTKRFGLGGVIGYRGKILTYSDQIDDESFLFPDYGGFNGLYLQKDVGGNLFESVISYNRDSSFHIVTKSLIYTRKNFPSIIIAQNKLKNRNSNQTFTDMKTALYKKHTYNKGEISVEFVADFNKQNNSTALLVDGKHKTKTQYFKYSMWNYGEAFLDISGGSKTSLISEKVIINSDSVNFDMSSKRSNQKGGLLKFKMSLSHLWDIDVASLYSIKNSDTTELQFFGKLQRKISSKTELAIDFLFRRKVRDENNFSSPHDKLQRRLLFVYAPAKLYVRTYLSYVDKTNELSYAGLFSEFKYRSNDYGLIHLWVNFSHVNYHANQLDYFYGFLKNELHLYDSFLVSFKLSHRYNRSSPNRYQKQFSIDMRWTI